MLFSRSKPDMVTPETALPDHDEPTFDISGVHAVNGHSMVPPWPEGTEVAVFAMGCFWGAERIFWRLPGVFSTAVGYAGGFTRNPTYNETCTGRTGHTEAVLVVYDPEQISYRRLLEVFFTEHDPTQVNGQGNDHGTQYRSAVYVTTDEQLAEATAGFEVFGDALAKAGKRPIATELAPAGEFFYAEEYHQQYLHKNPGGYCGLQGTGVVCQLPGPIADLGVDLDAAAVSKVVDAAEVDPKLKPVPESDDEWKQRLTPAQYQVLREAGTERAFAGAYTDVEEPGLYRCMACGNPLYTSDTKFHSGSGWPSFTEAVSPTAIELIDDSSHGMVRTEVRCGRCHSHLGHVFPDGPRDKGGLRFCMNSCALDLDQEPAEA
ncbi:peptide-methionine (S)-S-oxide reductase MsrA [Aquihabitans sp. McL0605]|uniref:peptide-methionine (S)-S-oxide reductase MsrA n=1 Tax=Aquihabitans sp. McL0605 TaxID=3415671 RepID=UPI003CFB20D9